MRKITRDAIRAFENGLDFKRNNTEVISCEQDKYRVLLLHGNIIAEMDYEGNVWINDGGWKTVTTKERLNGFSSINIVQKNYVWFLNGELWDGSKIKVNIW